MKKVERNDPCPCGSGKKYKQCCQKRDEGLAIDTRAKAASIPSALQQAIEHHQAGRLSQAEALYQQILQIEPDQPDALHLSGLIAHQIGKSDVAVELIGKAIALKPDFAYAHNSLGNILMERGKPDAAISCYRKALAFKPDYAEAHYNLGNILRDQGQFDESIVCYRKALIFDQNHANAYNNLGNALAVKGDLDAAIVCYRKSLALKPDYQEALCNLGSVLAALGQSVSALTCYMQVLRLDESPVIRSEFARCVCNNNFDHEIVGLRPLVLRAMTEAWTRPDDLSPAVISLIKLNPAVKECIAQTNKAWPVRLRRSELFGDSGFAAVSTEPLLLCLLENVLLTDVELERFLTVARYIMLDSIATELSGTQIISLGHNSQDAKVSDFFCSLARQCFINEYIFAFTGEEMDKAELLRERLIAALATGVQVPVLWLVAVAAYFPLSSLPSAEALLSQSWPDPVHALLTQQISEPMKERRMQTNIPRLTAIEEGISSLVQQQYEESPYPRWTRVSSCGNAAPVNSFLRRLFPLSPFKPVVKNEKIDILIAGCGTGRQSLEAAHQFSGAKILAVDLSLTSLSYATRKTQEFGLENIEYAQADIMKLGAINRTFDVIESVGVLHHLADPMAGWKILCSLLRPDGFMRLGFYSELARQQIVATRSFISGRGYASNMEDIRCARQDIVAMGMTSQIGGAASFGDFYGMSSCRDLLFHVQEYRYTIPHLKSNLEELGLKFIGFLLESNVREQYRRCFPGDKSMTNLDNWNIFEEANPYTFARMYQFWVQTCG